MQVVRMDVVLELAAVLLEPRPRDHASVFDPDADLPLVLATFMLPQPPGDVADVPAGAGSEQPPLLEGELLHCPDDLRCKPHEPQYRAGREAPSREREAGPSALRDFRDA